MAVPLLPPGVKQRGNLAGQRIDSRDIRPLVLVAVQATPREVAEDGWATVLLSNNVIDLKGQRIMDVRHPTIFATTICEPTERARQRSGHHVCFFPFDFSARRALDLRIPNVWPTLM